MLLIQSSSHWMLTLVKTFGEPVSVMIQVILVGQFLLFSNVGLCFLYCSLFPATIRQVNKMEDRDIQISYPHISWINAVVIVLKVDISVKIFVLRVLT
jgi:hypothetical protein